MPPAQVPAQPTPVPQPAPVRSPTPPPVDVMPRAAASAPHEHHTNTAAVVSGALFIGLLLGAAGGYYGGKFQTAMEQSTAAALQETQPTDADQAEAAATASSYTEVETNPLEAVQTNPFE